MKKSTIMKKRLPRFRSDKAAEDFVEKTDLREYDLSEMRPIRFEFQAKSKRVNMRLLRNCSMPCEPRRLRRACPTSASSARPSRTPCSANVRDTGTCGYLVALPKGLTREESEGSLRLRKAWSAQPTLGVPITQVSSWCTAQIKLNQFSHVLGRRNE